MAKYEVKLSQKIWEGCTVYVEASSSIEAEKLAEEKAFNDSSTQWKFICGSEDPVEIDSVVQLDGELLP